MESLVAFSIIIILTTIFIPIHTQIRMERVNHNDRILISSRLHDELQLLLVKPNNTLPQNYSLILYGKSVQFSFMMKNDLLKGCAHWKNAKFNKESICLYGYP